MKRRIKPSVFRRITEPSEANNDQERNPLRWIFYPLYGLVIGWFVSGAIYPKLLPYIPVDGWALQLVIVALFVVLGVLIASGGKSLLIPTENKRKMSVPSLRLGGEEGFGDLMYLAPAMWGALFAIKHGLIGLVLGPILTCLGFYLVYKVAVFWFSQRIAPLTMDKSQSKNLVYDAVLNYVDNVPSPANPDNMLPNVPASFYELGMGNIENHQCAVLFRGGRYSRQLEPGFASLNGGEKITQIIDVRPQIRRITQEFTTRDGLFFHCDIVLKFRISPPETQELIEHPQRFPYSPEAIRAFVHGDAVSEDGTERGSYDRVVTQVILYLSEMISEKTLDDLCSINNPNAEWELLIERVLQKSKNEFEGRGLQISEILIESVKLPEKILEVRRNAWKKQWKKPVAGNKLGGGISAISAEDAKIQLEVVQELMGNIEQFYDESEFPFRDEVYAKIRRVMGDIVTDSTLNAVIPKSKD